MSRNKIFSTAFNGLRSKYQAINTKAATTATTSTNNYTTVAAENGGMKWTGNYLSSSYPSPYYSRMMQIVYEGPQPRYFSSTGGRGGGMFAQKEAAIEEQWVYNKDRELLKIIKKKLAAKDAMAFAHPHYPPPFISPTATTATTNTSAVPLQMAKSVNFNPAFNTKGVRFQVRQSPLRLSEKAELLKNSSQTFYNNPVLNSRKLKLSADIQKSGRGTAASHTPQNQERLEKLKEKFFDARKP